ncbi:hypothetical protein [Nitratireductor sp. XY-223]|uniref:hypothetical protein n=1 Tax=Nitratireductor sp. XY-223 TaxID=2561926 RepID=UPI0010AB1843|nr:hypothetical protein [Nitratireductor sp. XY-223]
MAGALVSQLILHGCASPSEYHFITSGPVEAVGSSCGSVDENIVYEAALPELRRYDGTLFRSVEYGYRDVSEQQIVAIDQALARKLLAGKSVSSEPNGATNGRCRITFWMGTHTVMFPIQVLLPYRVEFSLNKGQIEEICLGLEIKERDRYSRPHDPEMVLNPDKFPNLKRDMIVANSDLYVKADGPPFVLRETWEPLRVLGSPCFDGNGQLVGYKQLFPELKNKP